MWKPLGNLLTKFCKIFKHKHDKGYPETFYRGLSTKDCLSGKYITEMAFRFDSLGHNPERTDDYRELSVNWNDDSKSLDTLLNQRKPGKEDKQFSVGYVIMSLKEVRKALRIQIGNGDFSYERRPVAADPDADIEANPYHGNLLMKGNLDKNATKIIQCTLANIATAGLMLRDQKQ